MVSCSVSITPYDAIIQFNEREYDFSSIVLTKKVEYNFIFSNTGKTPLIISNVKTSCGCAVPEWPREPIKPGEKGEIKVRYDAASPGFFHKTITVHYNGKDSPVQLSIKGQVEYPDI